MRIHKGKPKFSYKDTWHMDGVLSPLIYEGLKKYKEIAQVKAQSISGSFIEDMIDSGLIVRKADHSINKIYWEVLDKKWWETIDEMIYAFDLKSEPDIMEYNFSHVFEESDDTGLRGNFKCTNVGEIERYTNDMKAWNERCDKGREYFAKYYNSLWW
jgi:hypothetical protein